MSQKIRSGYCTNCQKNVKFLGEKPNHILHLLLTICTCGLWIIVWIFQTTDYRCNVCGRKAKYGPWAG
jgi:hypothetical protein